MTKDFDKNYDLIPMDKISDDAREIAKRWYDGVSEMNDIREKHKLASDIMNYAKQEAIEFTCWINKSIWYRVRNEDDNPKKETWHKQGVGSKTTEQLYTLFKNKS